ncbi:MAG: 2Fe-2S iron-sulfur cluster binding domain-containing protein, partial [Planctomycetota bacterium]
MEEFVVDFVDLGKAISVSEKTTLLEAARKLKICDTVPCINSEDCLACKILLHEGMIDYPSEPESSPQGNIVFACLAKVLSPCKVSFISDLKTAVPLRSELEDIPISEWALQNNGLFGFRLVSLEGPDPFEVLERDILKQIAHPGILALECDYTGWRKLQTSKKLYASYACLPGRAKILHLKEQPFSVQVFSLVLGATQAEILVWDPLLPKILYHTSKSYLELQSPYLLDLLRKAHRQSSLDYLLGGLVAGTPLQIQSFLGLSRPPYLTRPTELEKISVSGFPNAIGYPLQQGLGGNSSVLNATANYLKKRSPHSILIDVSERIVLACSPQQSWASIGEFSFPERSPKTKGPFSEKEWFSILLKIY